MQVQELNHVSREQRAINRKQDVRIRRQDEIQTLTVECRDEIKQLHANIEGREDGGDH